MVIRPSTRRSFVAGSGSPTTAAPKSRFLRSLSGGNGDVDEPASLAGSADVGPRLVGGGQGRCGPSRTNVGLPSPYKLFGVAAVDEVDVVACSTVSGSGVRGGASGDKESPLVPRPLSFISSASSSGVGSSGSPSSGGASGLARSHFRGNLGLRPKSTAPPGSIRRGLRSPLLNRRGNPEGRMTCALDARLRHSSALCGPRTARLSFAANPTHRNTKKKTNTQKKTTHRQTTKTTKKGECQY